jgi:hypothetical protein
MNKTLLAIALIAMLGLFAAAQDGRVLPPVHLGNQPHVVNSQHSVKGQISLFFCPPKTCLYYAGDPATGSDENGLFDYSNPGIGISDAEVWVGVKPTENAIVKGASGNMLTTNSSVGINPTPFEVQIGIKPGQGGKVVCNTSGNATEQAYGSNTFGLDSENYYIKQVSKPCHFKAKTIYYVWISPQYNDGSTVGYLADVGKPAKNHKGWPNIWGDSYFNSSSFGVTYENTSGSNGACGGIGCDLFSISLTGTEKK